MAHKVFVSYHHKLDQAYANAFRDFYGQDAFIDRSLDEAIDSDDDDYIMSIIRTEHLRESTVTVVLVGRDTWGRKWVDWEIYASLRPYGSRTRNALIGVLLPTATGLYPSRFYDNLLSGYAHLLRWSDIAPPWNLTPMYEWIHGAIPQRQLLSEEIERAFQRRFRDFYQNTRPRMRSDLT